MFGIENSDVSTSVAFLQPVEYNTGGLGASITYQRDETGAWVPYYKIKDYLGNTRIEFDETFSDISAYDYSAYGDAENLTNEKSRERYIGKGTDYETGFADHGVRKYSAEAGRFTCPDVLWEKYIGWSPYHYCANNPVMFLDGNGKKLQLNDIDGVGLGGVSEFIESTGNGFYNVSFTPTNTNSCSVAANLPSSFFMNISRSNKEGPLTEESSNFYDLMREATNENTPITSIDVVSLSSTGRFIAIGAYEGETIDMGDIQALPSIGDYFGAHTMFAHEISEQVMKQTGGYPNTNAGYMKCHLEGGCAAESQITGYSRMHWLDDRDALSYHLMRDQLYYNVNGESKSVRILYKDGRVVNVK